MPRSRWRRLDKRPADEQHALHSKPQRLVLRGACGRNAHAGGVTLGTEKLHLRLARRDGLRCPQVRAKMVSMRKGQVKTYGPPVERAEAMSGLPAEILSRGRA